jgi:glyceraldehyde 3-phosphate dehydrogenase
VKCSDEQNVSADMVGEDAAVVIEAVETHSRTGFIDVLLPAEAPGLPAEARGLPLDARGLPLDPASATAESALAVGRAGPQSIRIPVTHVKIFGWYDNEMGSYSHRLGELTAYVARNL